MSVGTCISCFAVRVKIYDVKDTYLHYVYETLTDYKIEHEKHCLCCICCRRLQQFYYMLNQIGKLQNSPEDVSNNVKHQPCVQNIENTSIPYYWVTVKQEPDNNQSLDELGNDARKLCKSKAKKTKKTEKKNLKMVPIEKKKVEKQRRCGKGPYNCDICDEKINFYNNLLRHMRTHTGEKPFSCNVCDKKFLRSDHLRLHEKIHTGDKRFCCDICGMKFVRDGHLKTHLKTHTLEKPYICDICEKGFATRFNLRVHITTHTGRKLYTCDICDKEYNRSSHLKIHERKHSGVKPYSCDVCDKKFIRSDHLKSHRKHTHNKP